MPIVAACRADVAMDSNTLRRVPEKHGNLHRNAAALDEMEGILTARDIVIKAAKPIALRVDAPDLALAGQPVTIDVTPAEPTRHAIHLAVTSETGTLVEARGSGHPPGRSPSAGSRPVRTLSTSPAPGPPRRSRRSAATSHLGNTSSPAAEHQKTLNPLPPWHLCSHAGPGIEARHYA